jgi:hypothetical protein
MLRAHTAGKILLELPRPWAFRQPAAPERGDDLGLLGSAKIRLVEFEYFIAHGNILHCGIDYQWYLRVILRV